MLLNLFLTDPIVIAIVLSCLSVALYVSLLLCCIILFYLFYSRASLKNSYADVTHLFK